MSIADRALKAREAEVEEERLRKEADHVKRGGIAYRSIMAMSERLEVHVEDDDVEHVRGGIWHSITKIDADADLVITACTHTDFTVDTEAHIVPCDQLYWNLRPGKETKGPGGGVYACYGLHGMKQRPLKSLADIGRELLLVRRAREQWNVKHKIATPKAIAEAVEAGKKEITEDIEGGEVPATVASFTELHDYVDANEYGGLCECNAHFDEIAANEVQGALDAWIKEGRP